MGRQTEFFALDDDNRTLLENCEQHGMRVVPGEILTGTSVEPVAPLAFERPGGLAVFYLLPSAVPPKAAVYEQMVDPSRSVLMPDKSAVIEFVTSRPEGSAIEDGRIYFDTPKSNPWFDDVRRDFERLSRFIKRWPSTDRFRFHVGPAAVEAVRAGRLRLRHVEYDLCLKEG